LISSGKLMGQSMLQFLRSAGRPELALAFIQDPLSRFCLALQSNKLDAAMEAAKLLDTTEAWSRLGNLAMLNGDVARAEVSYQKCRDYTKLMFLYVVTGQRHKLVKLARILRVKGDFSGVYQAHLLTGDKEEAAGLLEFSGNKQLADLMKSQKVDTDILNPPQAVCNRESNWPKVKEDDRIISNTEVRTEAYRDQLKETFEKSDIIDDPVETSDIEHDRKSFRNVTKFESVSPGHVPDLQEIIALLNSKYGVVNFSPLQQILFNCHLFSPSLPCSPSTPSLLLPVSVTASHLDHLLAKAHNLTTAGKFSSAVEMYRTVILTTTVSRDRQDKLVIMCAEYIVTLTMEMERKKSAKVTPLEKIRQCQLAIFATKYNILPVHQVLLLRSAISVCLKVGNSRSASALSKSLLTLSSSSEVSRFARSVLLNHAESEDTFPMDAIIDINPVICGGDFIVLDGSVAKCPLCSVQFGRVYCGHLCPVDGVARIGF